MNPSVCSFIGHRQIEETKNLVAQLNTVIEKLIVEKGVDTFLFGSKSQFNSLCYELLTQAKEKHPHIKRIYVRAEFPVIDDAYKAYLLTRYEDTYYPKRLVNAGKAAYVERNQEMINRSHFCVIYCKETPRTYKSGAKTALDQAIKQNKEIIRFPA